MSDNDELSARLRRVASIREAMTGPDVPYLKSTVAALMLEAADAIDQLTDAVEELHRGIGALLELARLDAILSKEGNR